MKAKATDSISSTTTSRMRLQKRRDTAPEIALRSVLHRLGFRFRVNAPLPFRSRRSADIIFRPAKLVVFVDGCFWHGCPEHGTWPKNNAAWWREKIISNVERDKDTDRRLRELGWSVIRVWSHEDAVTAGLTISTALKAAMPPQASDG